MSETRVAKYGLLRPVQGEHEVRAQMRAGHRYYNDLIALERTRRAVYRDIRGDGGRLAEPEQRVSDIAAQLAAVREAIRGANAEARSRVESARLRAQARDLSAQIKDARVALRAARAEVGADPEVRARVVDLDERGKRWHKGLRAATPAYWGTYLLAEASYDQARKAAVDPSVRPARGFERTSPVDGWAGEGRVGVQIQGGMTIAEAMAGDDTRLRIEPVSRDAWDHPMRGERRRAQRTRLWMRIGSEERAPVWAVFPLVMHREIPPDARIKGATVQLRVCGTREEWTVSITYAREAEQPAQLPGVVALDLGWRKRPDDSIRVAYWADDAGEHGEIVMPASIRAKIKHADGLREIQDLAYNRAQRWLTRWLRAAESAGVALPDCLDNARRYAHQWRSHARIRRLVLETWRGQRFAGDERIFAALERWAHQSRHLWQWEAREREKALRHRREVYRAAAAEIARRYGTVAVEEYDLAADKRLPAPEGEDAPVRAVRSQRFDAAPGELRAAIVQAVQREGGVAVPVPAKGTTTTCHACGASCDWDREQHLTHVCEHCGAEWDQDRNAAINILRERSSAQQSAVGARKEKKPSRFAAKNAKNRMTDAAE